MSGPAEQGPSRQQASLWLTSIEKAISGLLISRLSNVLIRAAKTVNAAIIGVEILEHWQRLKVHGMSLERYLGEKKMELLKREVEPLTRIQLSALLRWLLNEDRLREQQELEIKDVLLL